MCGSLVAGGSSGGGGGLLYAMTGFTNDPETDLSSLEWITLSVEFLVPRHHHPSRSSSLEMKIES